MTGTGSRGIGTRVSASVEGMQVARSLLDPHAVAEVVRSAYALDRVTDAVLLRRFVNDVYLLTDEDCRYIFKVYRPAWRDIPPILWEVDLLAQLSRQGAPVATAIPRADGRSVTVIQAPEGERYAVLFGYAEGEKPREPFTADLYYRFGHAAGLVHERSADFVSPYPRRPLDLATLLDKPLQALEPFLAGRPDDWTYVVNLARRLRRGITDLAGAGLDWGPCHQDMTLDNVHVTADGRVTFYDFDSGGPGWRSLDFQGIYDHAMYNRNGHWDAFLAGYSEVRSLSDADLAAIPYFVLAYAFWGTHADIIRSQWDGVSFLDDEYFDHRMGSSGWWRQWEAKHLP